MPASPLFDAAATTMTPALMALSIAAFSTGCVGALGPLPRLMLMTIGDPASTPVCSRVMCTTPCAIDDHQPLPFWFSTFTGMTVASGATPVTGVPFRLKPRMVLVTWVPWVFWSFSHHPGGVGVAPCAAAPPPTNAVAYCDAIRSTGKYARQVGSRPVSRIPMYTPFPVCATARTLVPGPVVTFTASRFHMLMPPV